MFVFTRGAGIIYTDEFHYLQRRNDPFGNVYGKAAERPEITHMYFSSAGVIDFHNKQRQGNLQLEKMENPRPVV